jgi:ATP-dependent RNA helicase SUPV3L1/SUV3
LATRAVEDKLSDALHERLTQRFIDRRTSVLLKRLAQRGELMSTVEEDGSIRVEGEYVGRIEGLQFIPDGSTDASPDGSPGKALKAASLQAVAQEISARSQAVAASADPDLAVRRDGAIIWQKAAIGQFKAAPVCSNAVEIMAAISSMAPTAKRCKPAGKIRRAICSAGSRTAGQTRKARAWKAACAESPSVGRALGFCRASRSPTR